MNFVHPSRLFELETPDAARLIVALLHARGQTATAGNRRSLFARMDELLGEPPRAVDPADVALMPLSLGGTDVRLVRMRLRNWKSFERVDLQFPSGGAGRSLVLVGGPNGFGKSSLLEAYAFGLFGRRAVSELGTLISGANGRAGQRRSYRSLLERGLHRSDHAQADAMCSVGLEFMTADGPIAVERKWYFNEARTLIEEDEELLVRIGDERNLLVPPSGFAARDWYQEEIERRIMPADLAPFFLFDGEQIERWADRQLTDQVRAALTRMLGLNDLRGLAEDLRAYAKDRERGLADDGVAAAQALRDELALLETERQSERDQLNAIDSDLADLRALRETSVQTLSRTRTLSHADLQGRLEAQHRLVADHARVRRELLGVMLDEAPLMFAGRALMAATASAIEADALHEVGLFDPGEIAALWNRFKNLHPPLDPGLVDLLRPRFEQAFAAEPRAAQSLAQPAYLDRTSRRAALARLEQCMNDGPGKIGEAVEAVRRVETAIADIAERAAREDRDATAWASAHDALARTSAQIDEREGLRGAVRTKIEAITALIEPKVAELERVHVRASDLEPRLRCAGTARSLAATIDAHLDRIADGEYDRFGAAVTHCFRELAHKDQIAEIRIAADGSVELLDANGRDITDFRLSAGESHLFTIALVAAVGELVGDRLPLLVDTPLGRLDTDHRRSMLGMLARRRAQTILLVQPEEVTGAQLQAVEKILAGRIELRHGVNLGSGVGTTSAETWASAAGADA